MLNYPFALCMDRRTFECAAPREQMEDNIEEDDLVVDRASCS